ncbi:MAG: RNA 2'-phosphotransferase [Desulfatirhabdiaceae bacterium]
MKHENKLAKLIAYILGRQPDEYGLVVNGNGFVKIKHLLQAIHEEPGFGYVRIFDIKALKSTLNAPFEFDETFIRNIDREHLPKPSICAIPPKLLYTAVRRKAYAHVLDNGLTPFSFSDIILTDTHKSAERFGKRIDPSPVVLTVQTRLSQDHGVEFFQIGTIFMAKLVPPGCFTGPPLARIAELEKQPESGGEKSRPKTPGSYVLEHIPEPAFQKSSSSKGRKKIIAWKKERKHRSMI